MENDITRNVMAQALLGDSNMLSAVASLLRKHNGTLERNAEMTSSMLVLGNNRSPEKDSICEDVILGSSPSNSGSKNGTDASSNKDTSNVLRRLEEVHALATANLVASTQREIAQQLAQEATYENKHNHTSVKIRPASEKSHSSNSKVKENNDSGLSRIELNCQNDTETSQVQALTCSFEGCDRKFAWQNHLKYHEMTHTNNRKFKCPVKPCSKQFFTAQRRDVHVRTHTGERPFTCPHQDCGKSFSTAGNLKNHQRTHTGERPFVCDYPNCNKSFAEHSSLKKHKRKHTGAKPFQCKQCGHTFTQSGSLSKHLLRHQLKEETRQTAKTESIGNLANKDEKCPPPLKVNKSTQSNFSENVPCTQQVIVLNNSYQDQFNGIPVNTSDGIVFSPGLTETSVTVDRQVEQALANSLLTSHGIQEGSLAEKSELVLLSESQVFGSEATASDMVYGADILNHEEVTSVNYVQTQVDYSGGIDTEVYKQQDDVNYTHQTDMTPHFKNEEAIVREIPNDFTHGVEITTNYTHQQDLNNYTHNEVFTRDYSHQVEVLPNFICQEENTDIPTDYTHQSKEETVSSGKSLSVQNILNEEKKENVSNENLGQKLVSKFCQKEKGLHNDNLSNRGIYMELLMWNEVPLQNK